MRGHHWPAGRALLIGLWCLSLLIGTALLLFRPVEATMPVYRDLARVLRAGPVASSFEPLGYPWLISLIPSASLDAAVKILTISTCGC